MVKKKSAAKPRKKQPKVAKKVVKYTPLTKMPKFLNLVPHAGLYWHIHHETLMEFSWDPYERILYIKHQKDVKEVAHRLVSMRPLSHMAVDAVCNRSDLDALIKAANIMRWTRQRYDAILTKAAYNAQINATEAYNKKLGAFYRTVDNNALKLWHDKECANFRHHAPLQCKWNGYSIQFDKA